MPNKLWVTFSAVTLTFASLATSVSAAAPSVSTKNVTSFKKVRLSAAPNGDTLWQRYEAGEVLSQKEMSELIIYVSSDTFLDNIHRLDRDGLDKWRSILDEIA